MRLFESDAFKESLETLRRNKMRSFLTAFGIFWGMFMLVFLIGGGKGFRGILNKQFEGFAQNSCIIASGQTTMAYKGFPEGRIWNLKYDDVELLKKKIPQLDIVTPINFTYTNVTYLSNTIGVNVKGVLPNYSIVENPFIKYGRYLNTSDNILRRKVCVIGHNISSQLFGKDVNPCGKFITINNIAFMVIGESNSNSTVAINGSPSWSIYIPFDTYNEIYNTRDVQGLSITVNPKYRVSDVEPKLYAVLSEAHQIHPDDEQAFFFFNMEQMFRMVNNLLKGVNILIWLIGLGTILSGAIGVSNIMMITVRDRTSEIGIRRAIGAHPSHIVSQIMTESIVMTLLAGFSGLFLGASVLNIVNIMVEKNDMPAQFMISFSFAIFSIVLFVVLGCLAGLMPSMRALAIKPVDAIRDE